MSCDFNLKSENINIARVGENFFSEDDLIDKLPKNLNSKDSTDLVNELIENWALNQLLIKNAEINLSDSEKNDIKKISENYYNDLLVSAYKNKVAVFNSDTMVNENDIAMLISIILEQNNNQFLGDINLDSKIDIIDLLYLSDYLYDQ